VHLADYTAGELAEMSRRHAESQFKLSFEKDLLEKLEVHIEECHGGEISKHNGGLAVNLTEAAVDRRAARLMAEEKQRQKVEAELCLEDEQQAMASPAAKKKETSKTRLTRDDIMKAKRKQEQKAVIPDLIDWCLKPIDFGIDMKEEAEIQEMRDAIDKEIEGLVGMAAGKALFDDMRKRVLYVENGGSKKVLQVCLNMVITGEHSDHMASCNADRCAVLHRESWSWKDHAGPTRVSVSACVWCAAEGHFRGEERAGAEGAVRRTDCASSGGDGARCHGRMVIECSRALHALTPCVGSLFIDEAYALAGDEAGNSDTFSKEVIRTLLTEVENNRTGFLVILAGYKDKMGRLMRADPGLPRRFPKQVHLDDYTPAEVTQIAETVATERFGAQFEDGLFDKLVTFIEENYGSQIKQHNGGLAVNLTEEAMGNLAERVMGEGIFGTEAATTLKAADYKIMEKEADELIKLREDVENEIRGLVGMAAGKTLFDDMRQRVQYVENGGSKRVLQVCLNMVITGGHCEVHGRRSELRSCLQGILESERPRWPGSSPAFCMRMVCCRRTLSWRRMGWS